MPPARASPPAQASEEADLAVEIAQYSAAQLFICFGADGGGGGCGGLGSSGGGGGGGGSACAGTSSSGAAGVGGAAGAGEEAAEGAGAGPLFDAESLQVWVLKGCQQPLKGGLRDKPGKAPDYYHTCYCLSGLSVAQHAARAQRGGGGGCGGGGGGGGNVLGGEGNLLEPTDLLINVVEAKAAAARAHFGALSPL